MKFRIIEEVEDTSLNRGHSRGELDLLLTPLEGSTAQDIEQALENRDFYGSYLVNTRDKTSVNKAIEDYFGPTLPTKKRPLEKLRGKPFPPKTKQAMDDFLKTMEGKPNLLTYEIRKDGKLLFPTDKNHSQLATANILKQVLGAAGIKYKLEKFENLAEFSKPLQEVKRMQKLAGITEIKVNNPNNIPFDKLQIGLTYDIMWKENGIIPVNEEVKIIDFDSDGNETWAMIKILSNTDEWIDKTGFETPDDLIIQLFPEELISAKRIK